MNIFKSAAIVLALAASLAVNAQPTTIKHKGLECTTCHVDHSERNLFQNVTAR